MRHGNDTGDTNINMAFFLLCAACLPRRSRAEPFSQRNKSKDGLTNFPRHCKKPIKQQCKRKPINAEVEVDHRPKTDCPISGVFGAGKTRAAAAIISGLITVDPSLKIMILTKENVASQAFAEPFMGLSLPSWIEAKIGRLVGFMALQNHTTSSTRLDIPTARRHDVLRTKQVIIGCGGGFRHECASKYSPVAQWMSEVDLALQDESQQYGNLDETAAIARLPRNCIVLWLGDHRQTPGGLRKSIVARRFRQKLLRRPVA